MRLFGVAQEPEPGASTSDPLIASDVDKYIVQPRVVDPNDTSDVDKYIVQPRVEQKPFVPQVTDDQIVGLARSRYANDVIEIDTDASVYRGDAGARVEAVVFVDRTEIEQMGEYHVPTDEEEDTYLPGPHMHALLTGARAEFTEDIRRGCNMAMLDNANQKPALWERIAKHTFTLLCLAGLCFYLGHGAGYKSGVADTFKATIQMLKSAVDQPEKVQ